MRISIVLSKGEEIHCSNMENVERRDNTKAREWEERENVREIRWK